MHKLQLLLLIPIFSFLVACGTSAPTPLVALSPTIAPLPTTAPESLCQKISLEPTPDSKETSLFPAVNDKDYVMGSKGAPMTIIEYGDFQ
jgi:hypothetical protein